MSFSVNGGSDQRGGFEGSVVYVKVQVTQQVPIQMSSLSFLPRVGILTWNYFSSLAQWKACVEHVYDSVVTLHPAA